MKAAHLNRHLERAASGLDLHERRMARDVKRVLDKAADEAARNFKAKATSFLAAAPPGATWAPPHPDEVLDAAALRAALDAAIAPHVDAALNDFVRELPACVPLKAREEAASEAVIGAAERALLASLADRARLDDDPEGELAPDADYD